MEFNMAETETPTIEDAVNAQKGSKPGTDVETDNDTKDKESEVEDDTLKLTPAQLSERIDRAIKKHDQEAKKQEDQAKLLNSMTEKQRQEHETQTLKDEIAALKLSNERAGMASNVRTKLSEGSINVSDAMIDLLVANDAETTSSNVDMFTKEFQKAVESHYQQQRIGSTPGSAHNTDKAESFGAMLKADEQGTKTQKSKAKDLWAD